MHLPGTDFDKDRWELFDLSRDPAEAQDLSQQQPAKLAAMKSLWWREARKYSTPPISEAAARFLRRNWFKDAFPPAGAEKN